MSLSHTPSGPYSESAGSESNTVRTLSSRTTFLYKILLPVLSLGFISRFLITFAGTDGFRRMFGDAGLKNPMPIELMALIVGFGIFASLSGIRLKVVKLNGNSLIASNFLRRTVIPLRDVDRVSGSILINPELAWIHLRTPGEFGTKIMFLPRTRFFSGFTRHPVVKELEALVEAARISPLP